jgi:predicted  nucleic acid-binding Zn-ribbon protein
VEIKDYKTYLNKSEKNKEKINYDPNIINSLLSQMNSLSEKQLSLIDVMDNIQMETQGQIKQLNKRISKLEKNLEELSNELYYLKNE